MDRTTTLRVKKIKEVMSYDVRCVLENTPMSEVEEIMEDYHCHHVPVTRIDRTYLGLLRKSDIDLLKDWRNKWKLPGGVDHDTKVLGSKLVADHVIVDAPALGENDTLGDCIDVFRDNQIHAIPVLQGKRVVGIITTYDLLMYAYH